MPRSRWTYDPRRELVLTHVSEPRWTGSGNVVQVEIVLEPERPRPEDAQGAPTEAQLVALTAFAEGVERLRPRIAEAMRAWWDGRPEPFRGREEQMWATGRRLAEHRRALAGAAGRPLPPDAPAPWDFTVTGVRIGRGAPVLVQVLLNRTVGVCVPVTVTMEGDRVLRVADEKSAWGDVVPTGAFTRAPPPPEAVRSPVPVAAAPLPGAGPTDGAARWSYDPERNCLAGELLVPGWSDDGRPSVPLEIGLGPDALRAWRAEDAAAREARLGSPEWQALERELASAGRASVDAARMDALLAAARGPDGVPVDFVGFVSAGQRAALAAFAADRDAFRAEVRSRVAAEQAAVDPGVRAASTARRRRLHEAAEGVRRTREAATGEPPTPPLPFVEVDQFFVERAWMTESDGSGPVELVLQARVEGAMARDLRVAILGDELRFG